MTSELAQLQFVDIPAGKHALGWRHKDALSAEARAGIESFMAWDDLLTRFSPARQVELPGFAIATTSVRAEDLLAHLDEDDDDHLMSIDDLCTVINGALAPHGLRLPSEDELEAASGGSVFPWGDQVPDGAPWGDETSFKGHVSPNAYGLQLNSNPYRVEVANAAFKLGDGGEALCGGYPWPVAWMSFCPSYRLVGEQVEDLLSEFFEEAYVRPVKL